MSAFLTRIAVGGCLALMTLTWSTTSSGTDLADSATDLAWSRLGVVLDLGPEGSFDERGLESPTVIRESEDQLVMWYRGRTFTDKKSRIMRAVSQDGENWTRTGVVMEPTELHEGDKIDPMTVVLEKGTYKMWYGGSGKGGSANYATSRDGIRWTRSNANPVLAKTARRWDSRGAGGQHSVLKIGDRWEMLYKGYGQRKGWIYYGLAVSDDGERWRKQGKWISPDPKIGENTLFRNSFAFRRAGLYYVVHAMAGRENLNLRLLHSDDGKTWNRSGVIFDKGQTPGDFDAKWATSANLLFENGRVRMWYEGGDATGKVRLLYAETSEEAFFVRALSGQVEAAN